MTKSNRNRVKDIAELLESLYKRDHGSFEAMIVLLKAQRLILVIQEDLNFRPEVND